MAKKIIGIVPSASLFETEDPYLDQYRFVNHYGKRIVESGGIPVGVLPVDGHAEQSLLEICDGFLLCGGRRIFPYHFEITEYAVEQKKPILGICLGMQTIGTWFRVKEEAKNRQFQGSLLTLYEQMKREKFMFTLPVEHHWDVQPKRGHLEEAKHPVHIKKETYLYQLLSEYEKDDLNQDQTEEAGSDAAAHGRETEKKDMIVQGLSLHHYQLNGTARVLTVSAKTEDGTIEGIEYGDKIVGVQFHPEADRCLERLFQRFFVFRDV